MISLAFQIEVDTSWEADYTVQIFTDFGDGSIDESTPLFEQALALFPGVAFPGGYGETPYGDGPYGGEGAVFANTGGYGDGPYGETEGGYGEGASYVEAFVPIELDAVGDWLFGVKVYDNAGNVQSAAITEFTFHVSSEDPDPPKTFSYGSYNSGTGVFTFNVAQ